MLRRLSRSVSFSLTGLLAAALLAACGSAPDLRTPPPLVRSRIAPPPTPASAPASAAAPVLAAPSAELPASAPVTPGASATPLETPAVAARFPEPSIAYPLPSLAPGRTEFTSAAEMQALLQGLTAAASTASGENPPSVTLLQLGSSQQGTPLQALLFTRHPSPSPSVIVRGGRPTVLLIGQQHGDEPASAEALLVLARELASGGLQGLLDRINVLILPRVNPDGALLAQAAAANGVDLDTDHLLLTTPEARAVASLARDYRPLVVIDAHEYPLDPGHAERFGGAQRADLLLQYASTAGLPDFVMKASEEWFRQPLVRALKGDGLTVDWSHRPVADVTARRMAMGTPSPDNARNVNGLRNAVSFIVESRGGNLGRTHLNRRVFSHVTAISHLLRSSAQRADDLVKLRKYVDASVRAELCSGEMLIDARLTPAEHSLVMLDPQTGEDKNVAVNWDSALLLRDGKPRSRPCGYWLAANQTEAVARLRGLGLRVEQLLEAVEMQGDVNTGAPVAGEREFLAFNAPAGSYYVPLSQAWARLVVAAMEPDSAHGLVARKVADGGPRRLVKVTTVPKVRRTIVP
ncbi:M14 family zinc carboxypeptidase [Rhizobacter sp. LjRoot28]|uniref:M14 family zinc carboxypeptidase n=1 Tax=Rhizobacter sp. LjRoot28 TaxID=3342309 RepID=UPI003ECD93A3